MDYDPLQWISMDYNLLLWILMNCVFTQIIDYNETKLMDYNDNVLD